MQRRRRPSHPPDYSKWLRLGIGAAAIIAVVLVTVLVWIPSRFVFLAGTIALGSAVLIWIYRDHLVQ